MNTRDRLDISDILNISRDNTFEEYYMKGPHMPHNVKKPVYYELIKEFYLDIPSTLRQVENWWTVPNQRQQLSKDAEKMNVPYQVGDWNFPTIVNGRLTIRKGYRWDGPTKQGKPEKHIKLMRASLVHCLIPRK